MRNYTNDIILLRKYEKFIIDKFNEWAEKDIITVGQSTYCGSIAHYTYDYPKDINCDKMISDFIECYNLKERYNLEMFDDIEKYYKYSITKFLKDTIRSVLDAKLNENTTSNIEKFIFRIEAERNCNFLKIQKITIQKIT